MSRYQAYQDYLAGRTIGETFDLAAAFLVLASRGAETAADGDDHEVRTPGL